MRNTKAFETAVADTLAELAKRGVTARPGTVAASSKKTSPPYPASFALKCAPPDGTWTPPPGRQPRRPAPAVGGRRRQGCRTGPHAPVGNPELALLLAGIPDSLEETGGDLYQVLINVAVNACSARHRARTRPRARVSDTGGVGHGECRDNGCEDQPGPAVVAQAGIWRSAG